MKGCPKCGQKLSLKWIYMSSYTAKYTCPGCNGTLMWTKLKRTKNSLAVCGSILITGFVLIPNFINKWLGNVSYAPLVAGLIAFMVCVGMTGLLDLILPNDVEVQE